MPPVLNRHRRTHPYLTPPWAGEDDDVLANLLRRPPLSEPEFGEGYGDVPALRRPPLHDIDRIAALGEADPLPTSEAEIPLLSRGLEMPRPKTPPIVIYDQGGRPTPRVFGTDDPEQGVMARRRALELYQPQKESKKSLALRTLLSFVGGGLAGPGGVAETLLGRGGVMDRRGKDRAWQQQELGRVDEQLGRMRTDRRAGLQDDLLKSQVMENRADAAAKMRERAVPPLKDIEVGGYLLRPNPTTGGYDTVYTPPSKPPDLFAGAQDVVDDKGNVIMVSRDGLPILNPATKQPFVRRLAPDEKPTKPDTSSSQREAIQANIAAAEAEKKTLGPAPPPTFKESWGEVKVNSAYEDWARRYRQLDDDIRKWKADLAKLPTAPPVTRRGDNDAAFEQRLRDEAKRKNLDPEKAVRRYREGKRAGKF